MFVPLTLEFLLDENMRSTGSTHRRTPINAWHRRPNAKGAVLKRIQIITRELETLQAEMHGELAESGLGKTSKFLEDSTAVEALNRFKVELDQLRRILWFYTEEAMRRTRPVNQQEPQSRRTGNAAPQLQPVSPKTSDSQTNLFKPGSLKPGLPKTGEPIHAVESVSFFDRLDNVIDTYMQGKKPVSRETTAAARRETKAFS